jgi:hypothetical protein
LHPCPLLENIAEDTTKISLEFWLPTGMTIEFLIPKSQQVMQFQALPAMKE